MKANIRDLKVNDINLGLNISSPYICKIIKLYVNMHDYIILFNIYVLRKLHTIYNAYYTYLM